MLEIPINKKLFNAISQTYIYCEEASTSRVSSHIYNKTDEILMNPVTVSFITERDIYRIILHQMRDI